MEQCGVQCTSALLLIYHLDLLIWQCQVTQVVSLPPPQSRTTCQETLGMGEVNLDLGMTVAMLSY